MENKLEKKTIIYAAIGTVLEWYDFTIYIYIASILSTLFFPTEDKLTSIISVFGVFAAGYLTRPLGGIFFGSIGDRFGRKKALILSVMFMTMVTLITALLPTYSQIGITAAILLTLVRMLQGFSVGGEYSGVLVMLIEQAGARNRGLITSFGPVVNGLGVMMSSFLIAMLTTFCSEQQMNSWGWRIPFIIGTLMGILFMLIQSQMKESPHFNKIKKENKILKTPLIEAFKKYPGKILTGVCLSGYVGISYYVLVAFVPTYLVSIFGVSSKSVMYISSIAALFYAFSAPFWGWLSDRVGRKKVLLYSSLTAIILVYPMFMLFATCSFLAILVSEIILTLIVVSFETTFDSAISELFPTKERYSGMAVSYNIGLSILGGISPFLSMYFIKVTGSNFAPAFFFIISAVLIVFVVFKMKETAFIPLED